MKAIHPTHEIFYGEWFDPMRPEVQSMSVRACRGPDTGRVRGIAA